MTLTWNLVIFKIKFNIDSIWTFHFHLWDLLEILKFYVKTNFYGPVGVQNLGNIFPPKKELNTVPVQSFQKNSFIQFPRDHHDGPQSIGQIRIWIFSLVSGSEHYKWRWPKILISGGRGRYRTWDLVTEVASTDTNSYCFPFLHSSPVFLSLWFSS